MIDSMTDPDNQDRGKLPREKLNQDILTIPKIYGIDNRLVEWYAFIVINVN
jgi:hypothetical protein